MASVGRTADSKALSERLLPMPEGDLQAIRRVGPARAADTTKINRAFRTAAAVDGSAGWTIPGAGPQLPGCWVTISNIGAAATDTLAVSFQRSSEGTPVNAATAVDFVMPAGTTQDWWCEQGVDTVRFGGPVTAVVSHYRSSL
jgi:hypothetical protein